MNKKKKRLVAEAVGAMLKSRKLVRYNSTFLYQSNIAGILDASGTINVIKSTNGDFSPIKVDDIVKTSLESNYTLIIQEGVIYVIKKYIPGRII
jgi:ribulose-5-phosphate 4-epimerase/fuculose-1-phosphate aldolase